jgi:hypothetical protein
MQFSDDKKVDILLALLKERYESSHKMRERSYKFTVWISGLAIALIWLVLNSYSLSYPQKLTLIILALVLGSLSIWFLRSIERGFNTNREVTINIEEALGCYESNFFGQGVLYPDQYKSSQKTRTSHFISLYILLGAVIVGLIIIVLISPCN